MSNHDVWDAVAATDGTPANSFEFLVASKRAGTFRQFADITNVNPAFTAKTRARTTYAQKGVDAAIKYGESVVLTWDHEAIRDALGQFQPDLQDLLDASKAKGVENLRELRAYDALGADYAFEGTFAISVARTNSGWDDAAFFTITATLYKFKAWIANPVLTGNVPQVGSVLPASAAAGATVYLEGAAFTGTTGVKFGGVAAVAPTIVHDGLLAVVVPAGPAGSAPIIVTNAAGAGEPAPFTRNA